MGFINRNKKYDLHLDAFELGNDDLVVTDGDGNHVCILMSKDRLTRKGSVMNASFDVSESNASIYELPYYYGVTEVKNKKFYIED